jgi:Spy/CpxP family protein refolding chaperone
MWSSKFVLGALAGVIGLAAAIPSVSDVAAQPTGGVSERRAAFRERVMERLQALRGGAMLGVADGSPVSGFVSGQLGRLLVLRSELNVTDEQKAQIRGLVSEHRDEIAQAAAGVIEARRALREAVVAETPNEETIRSLAGELGEAIGDAAVGTSKMVGQIKTILTPEQLELIRAFHENREGAVDAFLQRLVAGE